MLSTCMFFPINVKRFPFHVIGNKQLIKEWQGVSRVFLTSTYRFETVPEVLRPACRGTSGPCVEASRRRQTANARYSFPVQSEAVPSQILERVD